MTVHADVGRVSTVGVTAREGGSATTILHGHPRFTMTSKSETIRQSKLEHDQVRMHLAAAADEGTRATGLVATVTAEGTTFAAFAVTLLGEGTGCDVDEAMRCATAVLDLAISTVESA